VASGAGVTDPTPGNNSATDSDALAVLASLSITKTDGVDVVAPGAQTVYTVTVSNGGPSTATGTSVTDPVPAACTSVGYTASSTGGALGFTATGSGAIADSVTLPPSSSVTYTVTCTVATSGSWQVSNTASVTAGAGVTDTSADDDTAIDIDQIEFLPFADGFESGTLSPAWSDKANGGS
jgi:uncharacterized repeat protein (TIGR01451 family)